MHVLADIVAAQIERTHGSIVRLSNRLSANQPSPERGYGGASRTSSEVPRACSCRNDSLLVFSSSRRTR